MSQRFVRCPHCRLPHEQDAGECPVTGKPLDVKRSVPPSLPPPSLPEEELDSSDEVPSFRTPQPRSSPSLQAATSEPHLRAVGPVAQITDRIGQEFDGVYRVKGVLGKGGMAVVYEGEHIKLSRPVALKVLLVEKLQNTDARKRFFHEAQAAASLSHPNICRIYDFGTLPDGAPYCAMERLNGESLRARIDREGALSLTDAIDTALQMLAGLQAAHRKGIIHRDIKPENVFLATTPGVSRPIVKLLDFGLVKQVFTTEGSGEEDITQLTKTGVVVGTPYYMAPEMVYGQRDLDARVDLWAVGVVLYESICGKPPFRGTNWAETANSITRETPRPLLSIRPGAPQRLEEVLARAMAKDRNERFADAAEFGSALVRVRSELIRR